MKKLLPFLLLIVLFSACTSNLQPNATCPLVNCPAIFPGGILITYLNKSGSPVVVGDFHVIDIRTNKPIVTSSTLLLSPGTYVVADYSDKKDISVQGDSLQVSATDTVTNQTRVVIDIVAGGPCACNISKIAGPDTVKFN